jgi:hypothetical protein
MVATLASTMPEAPPAPSLVAELDQNETADIVEQPFLRFPPFPSPPPGVTIMPFSAFTAKGIVITNTIEGVSNAIEVDGLGIPTVPMRVKHATDGEAGAKKKKKKKKGGASGTTGGDPARPVSWWDGWAEGEAQRGLASRLDL